MTETPSSQSAVDRIEFAVDAYTEKDLTAILSDPDLDWTRVSDMLGMTIEEIVRFCDELGISLKTRPVDDLWIAAAATMDPRHGQSRPGYPGRHGRMFNSLAPVEVPDDALFELAQAMRDPYPDDAAGDNPQIPAGFTYLAQFVDHDITLDRQPPSVLGTDPLAAASFRAPALDLSVLYGYGPSQQPYLFQRDFHTGEIVAKLLIGTAAPSPDLTRQGPLIPTLPNDLPRNSVGRALIGDERNDENLLLSQTHVAFLKFHNKIVDMLHSSAPLLRGNALYDEARRIATWHYQWIVLHDLVERLTEPGLIGRIKREGRRFYRFKDVPYIPLEFTGAAFRVGHSMVRERYAYNRLFGPNGVSLATLGFLFMFTGKSGTIVGELAVDDTAGPGRPMKRLPSHWAIDWRRFYDFGRGLESSFRPGLSRTLDPLIAPSLHSLPGQSLSKESARGAVLPFRDLRRGVMLKLPSGQDVARAMGITPMTGDELGTDIQGAADGTLLKVLGLQHATPLWYYILKEAQLIHGGQRLGPVGATIIAETVLGMVQGDRRSFMWLRSNWTPELPRADPETFTMVDLLNFVGDLNPVG